LGSEGQGADEWIMEQALNEDNKQKRTNFYMKENAFVDHVMRYLKPTENAVYDVLNRFRDNETGWCHPSISDLVEITGYGPHSICKATDALAKFGLVKKRRAGKRFNFKMTYKILNNDEIDFCFLAQKLQQSRPRSIIEEKVQESSEKLPSNQDLIEEKVQSRFIEGNMQSGIVEEKVQDNKNTIKKLSNTTYITQIIEHWNSKGIIILKDQETKVKKKTITKIKALLEDYGPEEIIEAIDNYSQILMSKDHFFSCKWLLWEFLDRGLTKFLTRNKPFDNWLKGSKEYKPSQIGRYIPIKYTEEEEKLLPQIDAEYKKSLERVMKEEGWESEDDIDPFLVPPLSEYRERRLREIKSEGSRAA